MPTWAEDDDPPFDMPEDVLDGYRDYRRKTRGGKTFSEDIAKCRSSEIKGSYSAGSEPADGLSNSIGDRAGDRGGVGCG